MSAAVRGEQTSTWKRLLYTILFMLLICFLSILILYFMLQLLGISKLSASWKVAAVGYVSAIAGVVAWLSYAPRRPETESFPKLSLSKPVSPSAIPVPTRSKAPVPGNVLAGKRQVIGLLDANRFDEAEAILSQLQEIDEPDLAAWCAIQSRQIQRKRLRFS